MRNGDVKRPSDFVPNVKSARMPFLTMKTISGGIPASTRTSGITLQVFAELGRESATSSGIGEITDITRWAQKISAEFTFKSCSPTNFFGLRCCGIVNDLKQFYARENIGPKEQRLSVK